MKQLRFALVCLVVGFSVNLAAKDALEGLSSDFVWSHQKLDGEWKESQTWKGWLCDGYYNYNIALQGVLKKLDLELTDEGTMIATANLGDLFAKVIGQYRSQATMCLPMGGWLGAGSDWGQLRTEVHFGERADFKDTKLKILSTKLGRLNMGRLFPQWFEEFFTGVLNRALTVVWNSKLGAWISDKATAEIVKRIPERNR